jgi:transcriptional regulator with XRE-family HTH domain
MTLGNSISSEILALMGRNRVSQTELAAALGWTQPYISRRINGHTPWSIDDLEMIAEYFDRGLASIIADASGDGSGDHGYQGNRRYYEVAA